MTLKAARHLCRLAENQLGWVPPSAGGHRTNYQRMVAARMNEDIELFTLRNIDLAVELLHQERRTRSPLGVLGHVERAVAKSPESESDVEIAIQEAIRVEVAAGDKHGWETRFARSAGPYRAQALQEWRQYRTGTRRPGRKERQTR